MFYTCFKTNRNILIYKIAHNVCFHMKYIAYELISKLLRVRGGKKVNAIRALLPSVLNCWVSARSSIPTSSKQAKSFLKKCIISSAYFVIISKYLEYILIITF